MDANLMESNLPISYSLIPVAILSYMSIQTLLEGQAKQFLSLWWRAFQWQDTAKNNCSQGDVSSFQLILEWTQWLQRSTCSLKSSHMKNDYLTPCQPTGLFTFFPSVVLQLFGCIFKVTFYWEISVCLNLLICPCSKLYGEIQSSLPPDFGIQGKRVIPFPTQVSYWKISFFILRKLSPLEKLLEHRKVVQLGVSELMSIFS